MRNLGSLIALLLIAAVLLRSLTNAPTAINVQVSPHVVCGDTVSDTPTHDDNENDTAKIIVVIVIVIIVIIFAGNFANTETG